MKMYEPYVQWGFSNQEYIILLYLSLKKNTSRENMGISKNSGVSPQIIHFHRIFHYFHHPFWGVPPHIFGSTSICSEVSHVSMLQAAASQHSVSPSPSHPARGRKPVLEVETISNTEVNILHGRPKNLKMKTMGIKTSTIGLMSLSPIIWK